MKLKIIFFAAIAGLLALFLPTLFAQPFTSDIETFKQYHYPEWFRDAKFGIWSHWGPQALPRQGDWYARKMYESDTYNRQKNTPTGKPSREYLYHVEH